MGGALNPGFNSELTTGTANAPNPATPSGYGTVLQNTVNNNFPDYGFGVNINIPLRNRPAAGGSGTGADGVAADAAAAAAAVYSDAESML